MTVHSQSSAQMQTVALPANRVFVVQFRGAPAGQVAPIAGRVDHVTSGHRARFASWGSCSASSCQIAAVPIPAWVQGQLLPSAPGSGRERVITEWDSQFAQIGMHSRTIYRDRFLCTVYEATTRGVRFDLARVY